MASFTFKRVPSGSFIKRFSVEIDPMGSGLPRKPLMSADDMTCDKPLRKSQGTENTDLGGPTGVEKVPYGEG